MINPQLLDFVRQQQSAGVTADSIKKALLTRGWNEQDINEAFAGTNSINLSQPAPVSSSIVKNVLLGIVGLIVIGAIAGGAYFYFAPQPSSQSITDGSLQVPSKNTETQTTQPINTETQQVKPAVNTQQASTAATLQCGGVKIPLPEKWSTLENSKNAKLGADGCFRVENGCLCSKKDPNNPTKGVLFSVLIAYYPAGFTLDGLAENASRSGSVSNKRTFNLLGYPAIQFVGTGSSNKIGTTAFTKDGKLYQFDFAAQENTFGSMWSDVSSAVQNITFQ